MVGITSREFQRLGKIGRNRGKARKWTLVKIIGIRRKKGDGCTGKNRKRVISRQMSLKACGTTRVGEKMQNKHGIRSLVSLRNQREIFRIKRKITLTCPTEKNGRNKRRIN